jgi:hypothetical protein
MVQSQPGQTVNETLCPSTTKKKKRNCLEAEKCAPLGNLYYGWERKSYRRTGFNFVTFTQTNFNKFMLILLNHLLWLGSQYSGRLLDKAV